MLKISDMQETINKIEELSLFLKKLQPIKLEFQKKLENKFRLEFNYNSNHMEGNTLTYSETELLLIFDETKGNHTLREYEEMKAHDVALAMIKDWAGETERPLTEANIKNLNEIILVKPFWKDAITSDGQKTRRQIKIGDYKEFPNSVRLSNGEIFEYASVTDTPIMMNELIKWYRIEEHKNELHSVALAAMLHYKLVRIHPFDDGNGRISRLLMNYVLMKNDLPPVVIKSNDKRNYLSALNSADAGDLNSFIKYIGQQLIWSLELSIKAAKGESIEDEDDLDKEISLWKKQASLNKVEDIHRNDELVYELYSKGVREMFEDFIDKHKQFNEMFSRVSVRSFMNQNSSEGLDWLNKIAEQIVYRPKEDTYKSILVEVRFEDYKYNQKNPFSMTSWLRFNFLPYTYEVKCNGNDVSEKKYGEYLTKVECKKVVSDCIKALFADIKTRLM